MLLLKLFYFRIQSDNERPCNCKINAQTQFDITHFELQWRAEGERRIEDGKGRSGKE